MMTGQDPGNRKPTHTLHGLPEQNGIGRRIKCVQTAAADEVPRVEISPFLLIKTAVPRRMPRRVQDVQCSSAEFQPVAVMQDPVRFAPENTVFRRVKSGRKFARPACQMLSDNGKRQRKPFRQPARSAS